MVLIFVGGYHKLSAWLKAMFSFCMPASDQIEFLCGNNVLKVFELTLHSIEKQQQQEKKLYS